MCGIVLVWKWLKILKYSSYVMNVLREVLSNTFSFYFPGQEIQSCMQYKCNRIHYHTMHVAAYHCNFSPMATHPHLEGHFPHEAVSLAVQLKRRGHPSWALKTENWPWDHFRTFRIFYQYHSHWFLSLFPNEYRNKFSIKITADS